MQFRVLLLANASIIGLLVCALNLSGIQSPTAASQQEPLPRIPPKEPAEALTTFRSLDGFRMDLLAYEPAVTDPVAMDYDENGLAYVAEMRDYPYTDKSTDKPNVERTTDLPLGRVRVLQDVDGDGRFDKSTVFAEDLSWPTGVACWKGGVFVAATPDIWYLKDTDGDHRADVREKWYTGFRKFNVQAVMNNLKWGLDHQIYGAGGTNGGTIRTLANAEAKPVTLSRNDFRFNPVTGRFEAISGGQRFGNSFDDWGNRFLCNIRNPAQHVVLPSHYLARNPFLPVASAVHDVAEAGDQLPVYRASPPELWRAVRAKRWVAEGQNFPRSELAAEGFFTSSSGVTVYRGAAYPEKYRGNIFVCEVAGNLVHRLTVEPDGVTFVAKRADEKAEFVASTDNWFRPVNFVNAPDGTLHVLDMYREVIEHPWSIPDDIKAQLDLESGRDRGRIYRLAPPDFHAPRPPRLGAATTAELVACLENPNGWWRDTAHRLIFERQDKAAAPLLRQLRERSTSPLARLHAMWSLAGLGELRDDDLAAARRDAEPHVRADAVRLSEGRLRDLPNARRRELAQLLYDPDTRVRFQAAFAFAELPDTLRLHLLADLAVMDSEDTWVRTAILSSSADCAGRLFSRLARKPQYVASDGGRSMLSQLAQVAAASKRSDEIREVWMALVAATHAEPSREFEREIVAGLGDGLRRAGNSLANAVKTEAPGAEQLVARVMDEARRSAGDSSLPVDQRESAVRLLSHAEFAAAMPALEALISPREPSALQLAAVRAIGAFADPRVARLLLGRWRSLTPAGRNEAVEVMFSRTDRLARLLDAVESETVSRGDISANRQAVLLRHSNEGIRLRAAKLFTPDSPGARAAVVAKYRAALELKPDRQRGQNILERECLTCHRLGDKGHDVGPSLAATLHHTPDQMLVHIFDPSREVSPNYLEYIVALDDGRTVSGVIAAETATTVTLRRAENVEETVLRTNIDEIASTGKSLMPDGLETKITVQETADLIRYLLGKDR